MASTTRSVLTLRAKHGRRDELIQTFERLGVFSASSKLPGFLGAELQVPLDDEHDVLVTALWIGPDAYQAWLESAVRAEIAEQLEPLLDGEPQSRTYVIVHALAS